ncbi:MAG: hypothetical protein SynsKO_25650 [Synoicihabitans sp.]
MTTARAAALLIKIVLLTGVITTGRAAPLEFRELPLPSKSGSAFADLAYAQDGNVYASWIESGEADDHALRVARFDRETESWGKPTTIATGENWFLNAADTPQIATGLRGRVAAAWYVNNSDGGYHARISTSTDYGANWTAGEVLTRESDKTEFVELAPLLNGKWLAVWLDARDRAASGNMQLRSREIGSEAPDQLVDDRVCDCCSITSLVLPNGRVLTAYRDRSADEIRDIAYQTYNRGEWSPSAAPIDDGWKIEGCPVNGASLGRRSGQVAAAWFTGANDTPQVLTARSNNLGRSWNLVTRMDDPTVPTKGQVNVAVLRDGSQWISWLENTGTFALRGLKRDGSRTATYRLPHPSEGRPNMVLLSNRSDRGAELLIAQSERDRVKTYIAQLPDDADATLDDCGCDPGEEANRGHAVKGEIVDILQDRDALLVKHEEVPGVMMAMTMAFQVDRRVLNLVKAGQNISGRMERRDDGKWWLFGIRILDSVN